VYAKDANMQREIGRMLQEGIDTDDKSWRSRLYHDIVEWHTTVMGFEAEIAQHLTKNMMAFLLDDRLMNHEVLWERLAHETHMKERLIDRGYDLAHIADVPMAMRLQLCLRDEFLE
jgi:hypothetical protein